MQSSNQIYSEADAGAILSMNFLIQGLGVDYVF